MSKRGPGGGGNGSSKVIVHTRDEGGWLRVFTDPLTDVPTDLLAWLSHAATAWLRSATALAPRVHPARGPRRLPGGAAPLVRAARLPGPVGPPPNACRMSGACPKGDNRERLHVRFVVVEAAEAGRVEQRHDELCLRPGRARRGRRRCWSWRRRGRPTRTAGRRVGAWGEEVEPCVTAPSW